MADLDAAMRFYAETFGMHCVHEETNEEQGVREAMLAVGDGSGPRLQLLAPLRPDSAIAKFLDRSGPGLQQLAYTVADVEATARRVAGPRPAAALRHPAAGHGRLADQLRAPQGRRRRSGGIGASPPDYVRLDG